MAGRQRPEAGGPELCGGERTSGCGGFGDSRPARVRALRRGWPARVERRGSGPLLWGERGRDGDGDAGAGRAPAGRAAPGLELAVMNTFPFWKSVSQQSSGDLHCVRAAMLLLLVLVFNICTVICCQILELHPL